MLKLKKSFFFQESKQKIKPVVLITGCNTGLGYALVKELYGGDQYRVVATARSILSIAKLINEFPENDDFIIRRLDVTDADNRESLIAEIFSKWKSIDVLINNAGISYRSVIEHMDNISELRQLDVNYLSPLALIRLVIPSMRERGGGRIINVSSVSGMMAMPTMASYSASKHALEGATEALWYELKPYGISVTLMQPGFIRSSSYENVYYSKKAELSRELDGPYSEYYSNMSTFVEKLMKRSPSCPNDVARKIIHTMKAKSPPLWMPVTPDAVFFYWLRKLFPRQLFHKIMFKLLPKADDWGAKYKNKTRIMPLGQPYSQNS